MGVKLNYQFDSDFSSHKYKNEKLISFEVATFFHHPGEPLPDLAVKFNAGWIVFKNIPVVIWFVTG